MDALVGGDEDDDLLDSDDEDGDGYGNGAVTMMSKKHAEGLQRSKHPQSLLSGKAKESEKSEEEEEEKQKNSVQHTVFC